MTIAAVGERFARTAWPGRLRPYQTTALDALEARWRSGRDRAWVVLPPGAGKTLLGLEAARRLGRQTVVFAPNTAIQNQWVAHWERFVPATVGVGTDRALGADICVLTYQSLAVFDPDAETDEEGHDLLSGDRRSAAATRGPGLLRRLHPNGRALIGALAAAGPLTLILDECHHLLDVWGRLLAEVLDQVPDAKVVGLTATPPESLTAEETGLVDSLFGVPILGASIPALVRQNYLASFAELAWLTPPTAIEAAYIAEEAERFTELTTDLLEPGFASTGFLDWLDARFVRRAAPAAAARAETPGPPDSATPEPATLEATLDTTLLETGTPDATTSNTTAPNSTAPSMTASETAAPHKTASETAAPGTMASTTVLSETARTLSWARLERDQPQLAAAALRLHYAGLLALPPGARIREEHRHEPAAEDWVELLGDYVRHCLRASSDERDAAAVEAIRRALPAVGYQLTKRGIRAARSPVDRVLARSAAKTYGAVEIVAAEAAAIDRRLRCLVLCDHERVSARLPARLTRVLDSEAGSAWLVLQNLAADARTRECHPMLVTGRTVAAGRDTARRFVEWADERGVSVTTDCGIGSGTDETSADRTDAGRISGDASREATGIDGVGARGDGGGAAAAGGLTTIVGTAPGQWSSRTWVPLVTEFFEAGHCQVLVGTRALLGEGWDARGINALIDLTTATTATSVVQTRGRALRKDPGWADKVANTWSVVCLTDRHPKGAADWDRFVRKHEGYLAATADGEIVSGVAHVAAEFSPYAPPPVAECDAINASMLERARDRDATRATWRIGSGFRDELVHTIRIRPDRRRPASAPATGGAEPARAAGSTAGRPARLPAETGAVPVPHRGVVPTLRRAAFAIPVIGGAAGFAIGLSSGDAMSLQDFWRLAAGASGALLLMLLLPVLARRVLGGWAGHRLEEAAGEPELTRFACAVADALAATGLSRRGAEAVEVRVEPDGSYRFCLGDVDTAVSRRFATALDEMLAPMAAPRYVIPRYVLRRRSGRERRRRGRAWLRGDARADGVVYHAVPAVLAQNRTRARAFADAWNAWVSAGRPLYTGTPEGEGVLVTHRGADPLAATTVLRVAWS